MTNETHTPTPWTMEQGSLFGVDDGYTAHIADFDFNEDDNEYSKENAAHIVKCVNLHDELVEVLQWIADNSMCEGAVFASTEALKKAGAL